MKKTLKIAIELLILVCLVFFMSLANAEEEERKPTRLDWGRAELEYNIAAYKNSTSSLLAEETYLNAQVQHHKNLMEIAEEAYRTQHTVTILIFVIVSILVLGGLVLSYLQFTKDSRTQADNTSKDSVEGGNGKPAGGNVEMPKASFKIGKDGIEFNSSVIGLIVLFMSFFFFHLYVKDVYKLNTNQVNPIIFESEQDQNEKTK